MKRNRGAVDLEISRSIFGTLDGLVVFLFPGRFRQRFNLLDPVADQNFLNGKLSKSVPAMTMTEQGLCHIF